MSSTAIDDGGMARILLVDDRLENLLVLEAILEPLGRTLVRAQSGEEALRCLLDQEFAVILLDVQMPSFDGFETAAFIKGREQTRHVPLIFLTALSGERDYVFRGYQAGAVDYLTKPFEPEILLSKVRVFIELYEQQKRIKAQEAALWEAAVQAHEQELSHARRETRLKMREARVLSALSEGVFLVDEAGLVHLWNPAATHILGIEEEEALGRRLTNLMPGWALIAGLISITESVQEEAQISVVPLEVRGRELWLSFGAVRAQDGVIYVLRDWTATRELERLRSDFLSIGSHELKTPLASVIGAAKTLARTDISLDTKTRAQLGQIVSQESDRLIVIINDVLVAGRVGSGSQRSHAERTNVVAAINETVAAVRPRLPDNLDLVVQLDPQLPSAEADPAHLRQVLGNLVENSIKYSPEGGRIAITASADASGAVRIDVLDQGLGIPAGEEERVFEKFCRLDSVLSKDIAGTGLGLYICRELIERSGGRIWAECQPEGVLFAIELSAVLTRPQEKTPLLD